MTLSHYDVNELINFDAGKRSELTEEETEIALLYRAASNDDKEVVKTVLKKYKESRPASFDVKAVIQVNNVRRWLISRRKEADMSQATVAHKAGISQSYYAQIETGERGQPLTVTTAKAIADVLGFPWTDFYKEE